MINQNKEKILADNSKIKSQQYELEFQTNQLLNLINNDLNKYEAGLEIAKKFPLSTIKKSLENLSQANQDFKRGVLDFIIYIELDSQEYQMIDTVLDNQLQLAISYSNLMTKIGKFIFIENH